MLILSGGVSKRLISLDTGFQVAKELKKMVIKLKLLSQTIIYQKILKFKPHVIFTTWQFGEDGYSNLFLR